MTHVSAYSVITSQKDESIVVGGAYAAARLFFHDFDNKDKKHEIQSIARQVSSFVLKLTADGKIEWLIGPTVFNMQYVTAVGIDDKNRGSLKKIRRKKKKNRRCWWCFIFLCVCFVLMYTTISYAYYHRTLYSFF